MNEIYCGIKKLSVRKTRYPFLGFTQVNQDWRFVDLTVPGDVALVGPIYKSKAELLADMDHYAQEFGMVAGYMIIYGKQRGRD